MQQNRYFNCKEEGGEDRQECLGLHGFEVTDSGVHGWQFDRLFIK
jgi:hypothetical protein